MDVTNFNRDKKPKRPPLIDMNTMVYGKIPPQAKDLEQVILGAVMLERSAWDKVANMLTPDMFYMDAHQRVWKSFQRLISKNRPIDLLLVAEELRFSEELDLVGGAYYLTELSKSVASSANIVSHAHIVMQKFINRRIIAAGIEMIQAAYEDSADPFDILQDADNAIFQTSALMTRGREEKFHDIAQELTMKLLNPEQLSPEQRILRYLYTYNQDWDRVNGPLFPGIYVIAARPGAGKTAFTVQMLVDMARKFPVGFINAEMSAEQSVKRIISNLGAFNNWEFKQQAETWPAEVQKHFLESMQKTYELNLHIESGIYEVDQVVNQIRYWKRQYGVKVVAIDYLQILKVSHDLGKYMTETAALNYIMEKIRVCAKTENVPVFLLSQMNRDILKRAGTKEPNLADLKGSGDIEQSAYQILFLHRPEYYDESEFDEYGESIKGLCIGIIAKHRDGELARLKMKFEPQFSRFSTWVSNIPTMPVKDPDAEQLTIPQFTQREIGSIPVEDLPF